VKIQWALLIGENTMGLAARRKIQWALLSGEKYNGLCCTVKNTMGLAER